MKILYLLHTSGMAGATMSLLTLAKGIKSFGFTPIFVIPHKNDDLEMLLSINEIKYYIVPLSEFSYPIPVTLKQKIGYPLFFIRKLIQYKLNLKTIKSIAITEDIKIIHTNVGPIREGHVVARNLSIPHVWHIREYGDLDFSIKHFPSKKFFHQSLIKDYVITITKDLKLYNNLEHYANAYVVYNGVRKKSEVIYYEEKEPYFLCASRISPEKGLDDVIEAFGKFHSNHPKHKLIILGSGDASYIECLKQKAADNGIENHVVFGGFTKDVSDYMKRAHALIVASPAEGFGRMTAEAIFAGSLVIGRNSAGTKEILEQTGGLLFDTVDDLINKMEESISISQNEYRNIVRTSQAIAVSLFSEEEYVKSVIDIYNYALQF